MSKIVLNSIIVEGFGSIVKQVQFKLDRGSLWFVKGPNGAGKTTIFSALMWVLYKANLKGLNNDKMPSWVRIRGKDFRGTRVVLDMYDDTYDYMIARHINFKGTTRGIEGKSSLMIFRKPIVENRTFESTDLLGEAQYKDDQQVFIEGVLGLNSKAFLNSILFGQKMKRLIEADNADKRALFEDLFDLDFIADMRKRANADYAEVERRVKAYEADLNLKKQSKASLEGQITSQENLKTQVEASFKVQCDKLKAELVEATSKVEVAKSQLTVKELSAKQYDEKIIVDTTEIISTKNLEIQNISEAISKLKVTFQDSVSKKYNKLQEDLELKMEAARKSKTSKLVELRNLVTDHESKVTAQNGDISVLKKDVQVTSESIADLGREVKRTENEIVKLETAVDKVETVCPTCEGPLKPEKVAGAISNIKAQITQAKEVMKVLQTKLTSTEEFLVEQNKKVQTANTILLTLQGNLKNAQDNLTTEQAKDYGIPELQVEFNNYVTLKNSELNIETNEEYLRFNRKIEAARADKIQAETDLGVLSRANQKFKADKEELPLLQHTITQQTEHKIKLELDLNALIAQGPTKIDLVPLRRSLTGVIAEIDAVTKTYDERLLELDRIRWWLGIGLGASGIKAYVFSAMLNELNNAADKYSARLGLRVKFSVDLTKVSKPFTTTCYKDNHEIMYQELSGGQKQRIDIVMALALHDIIARNSNFNILIFDEAFEGLDEEGRSIVLDLIKQKAEDKTVFIISHADIMEALGAKYIYFETDEFERTQIS